MNPISQLSATRHQRAAIHQADRRLRLAGTSGLRPAAHDDSERSTDMTHDTPTGGAEAGRQYPAGRIRAAVARLTAAVHAAGDERARTAGWTVTATTGRFGLSTRTYRDPRFGPPSLARPAAALRECRPANGAPDSGPATATRTTRPAAATRATWPPPATREARPATAARGRR